MTTRSSAADGIMSEPRSRSTRGWLLPRELNGPHRARADHPAPVGAERTVRGDFERLEPVADPGLLDEGAPSTRRLMIKGPDAARQKRLIYRSPELGGRPYQHTVVN